VRTFTRTIIALLSTHHQQQPFTANENIHHTHENTGKSTLVKMILGKVTPDSGTFTVGDTVKLAVVDQDRENLDGERSVFDEITSGSDFLQLGSAEVNSRAFCSWFGFKVERYRFILCTCIHTYTHAHTYTNTHIHTQI